MPTIAQLLAASSLPLLDARALLAPLLGVTRETLIAHPERAVAEADAARFAELAARRRDGEPLAYLLGVREFYGRDFAVTPAVLVPRPETELLVQAGLAVVDGPAPRILDLGTGSGCIAISLALERRDAEVVAVDRSAAALEVARGNAQRLGAQVRFIESDWFSALAGEPPFDLIVANPPYVAADDPHLTALAHEPASALVAGADGLDDLRVIAREAPRHLKQDGALMVEHGHDQAARVRALLRAAQFADVGSQRDLQGIERVTHGRRR